MSRRMFLKLVLKVCIKTSKNKYIKLLDYIL